MEQGQKFTYKLKNFQTSVKQFEDSLNISLNKFDSIERDAIMNGQIQKFEICEELLWKTVQTFLREKHGIDTVSPKTAMKEFYSTKYLDEVQYEIVMEMIEDRNKLSHIYDEMFFKEIYAHLNSYLLVFNKILNSLKQ